METDNVQSFQNNDKLLPDTFDRVETYNYYNFQESKGDAAAFLVGNAMTGTTKAYEMMETEDITLHLIIAKFVRTLSRIQRVEFALILELLEKKYFTSMKKDSNEDFGKGGCRQQQSLRTTFPVNDAALRNMYMVGKDSIVNNLPRPNVKLIDGHSYVSVRQCIANFLASGRMPKKINTCKHNTI